jgi:hypothetical protein
VTDKALEHVDDRSLEQGLKAARTGSQFLVAAQAAAWLAAA